jgi:GNAT superfamily N-acetyltransferase
VTPASNVNEVVLMALLGGYVWSFYQIISRAVDRELTPSDLYEITLGYIVSVPIGYVFSLLTDDLPNVRRVGAFVASAFPVRESNLLLRQYLMKKVGEPGVAAAARTMTERSLRTAIQGVSDSNLARLAELRIFTVLDMAYCDPIRVMVQTGFPLAVIIDWMDQSLWALYAGDFDGSFAKLGLRCSLDVCEFVDTHMPKRGDTLPREPVTDNDREQLKVVADKLGSTPVLTQDLFLRIYLDPQVQTIRGLWYATGLPGEFGGKRAPSAFPYDTPAAAEIEKDAELWALYEKSFPTAEREPPKVIIKTVSSGKGFVVRSRANGITTGFSVVHMLEDPHAAFLVYLAVAPEHQSRGLGRGLLDISWQYARNQSAAEKKALTGMVWEVDLPDGAPNEKKRNLSERRIHFFEQFGANVCRMAYKQPPLVDAAPVPMHLMFKSAGGASMPDDAAVRKLVRAMYGEKYHDMNGIDREVLDKLLAA